MVGPREHQLLSPVTLLVIDYGKLGFFTLNQRKKNSLVCPYFSSWKQIHPGKPLFQTKGIGCLNDIDSGEKVKLFYGT